MSDASTIGGIGGSAQQVQQAAPAPVVAQSAAQQPAAQQTNSANTQPAANTVSTSSIASSSGQAPVISPKIVFDPLVGIITEYVNSQGKVTEQTPSLAAVAYLHAGLTAQGLNKTQPGEVPAHHAAGGGAGTHGAHKTAAFA